MLRSIRPILLAAPLLALPTARPAGDEVSEFALVHKYGAPAHQAVSAADRKEFTYSITSVMQFAKPYRAADMTDDYQDARVIREDTDSITVEITYYPLNTNGEAIGENPDWRRDYAGMTEYLRPTAAENWDDKMRTDLLAALRADGIDPERLTDRQLVTQVSGWLMRRSSYTKAFAIWDVDFSTGAPRVFPALRSAFDKEKPSPDWTDQAMFDQEALGRAMFYNKVHGSCTSSAVLISTVMRALGIPTRIVFFVPPADANDSKQVEMLLNAIHHNRVRKMIRHGIGGGGGFTNHLYNEVYVGNRWVRLNYDALGQDILDEEYLGLMTHIFTAASLTDVSMPETWGTRIAMYPKVGPALSSVNPYRLLAVSDHIGTKVSIPNPEVDDEELRKVTVVEAYWRNALPTAVADRLKDDPTGSDFYIGIREYIPHYRLQMREFARKAGREMALWAEGKPDVKVTLTNMKFSMSTKEGRHYQLFGAKVEADSRGRMEAGVAYRIRPLNTSETYAWSVADGLTLAGADLAGGR